MRKTLIGLTSALTVGLCGRSTYTGLGLSGLGYTGDCRCRGWWYRPWSRDHLRSGPDHGIDRFSTTRQPGSATGHL
jgi:hypothetical protein